MAKKPLDKDLRKFTGLTAASAGVTRQLTYPALALLFLGAAALYAALVVGDAPMAAYVVVGAFIAGYLALNIGANDVANNVGPAVGSKAITLTAALVIAAVCEAAGAILAGGDVVETISKGIITPPAAMEAAEFILVMMAALFAAAVWVNLATVLGAPVSTTHAIVGGVIGSGVAAAGPGIVAWPTLGGIVASWVISPVMGGVVAAALLAAIKWLILFREDRVAAARRWVPALVALMSGVFVLYMGMKGLRQVWSPSPMLMYGGAVIAFFGSWALARPWVARRSIGMENRRKHISKLFVLPLIFAAALLSFAHGANDVANAVGPLAAIVAAAQTGLAAPGDVTLPLWILVIGALGISLGLALFGPRVIRTVGEQITKIDPMRAYCVALSAAMTVLVASAMGLPVSSTHTAIGGVFGVGLLREVLTNKGVRRRNGGNPRPPKLDGSMKAALKAQKRENRRLVRRRHIWSIAAAWVVTVPAAAVLSGLLYLGLALVVGQVQGG